MFNFLNLVHTTPELRLRYEGDYDPALVTTSVTIAILAAYVALMVSRRMAIEPRQRARRVWQSVGGVVMGAGVWSMHFIAMLAFHLPCATTYDPGITALSILPAMFASGYMVGLIARPHLNFSHLLLGGFIMGAGIGVMHYTGMAAYRIQGIVQYDLVLFCLSILVAISLAILAIKVKFKLGNDEKGHWDDPALLGGSLLIGLAISGMHYTAMEATYFIRADDSTAHLASLSPEFMAGIILAVVGSLILVALLALYLSQVTIHSLRLPWQSSLFAMTTWTLLAWLIAQEYNTRMTVATYTNESEVTKQLLARLTLDVGNRLHTFDNLAQLLGRLGAVQHLLSTKEKTTSDTTAPRSGNSPQQRLVEEWMTGASEGMHARFWLTDLRGLCIAGCSEPETGGIDAGQPYFEAVHQGKAGHHYDSTRLKMTHAYPVKDQDTVIGAVLVTYELATLREALTGNEAFIADQAGVVLLSADTDWQMCTLPESKAAHMSGAEQVANYGRSPLTRLPGVLCKGGRLADLYQISGTDEPVIIQHATLPDHPLTLYVRRPAPEIQRIAERQLGLFAMLALMGDMLILSLSVITLHLQTLRRDKETALDNQVHIHQALQDLDTERSRLEKILELAPVPMAYADPDGIITHRSQAFLSLFGYSATDIPDVNHWFKTVYPDANYRQKLRKQWTSAIANASAANGVTVPAVCHITCKNGTIRECEIHGIILANGGQLVTLIDLTDRLKADQALIDKETRYRTLYEHSHDAILLYVADHTGFVDCNSKALELFGFHNKKELLGHHPIDLSPLRQADGSDSQTLIRQYIDLAAAGKLCHFEWLHRKPNGTIFPVDILLSRLELGSEKLIQATLRDISEIKLARERLEFLAHHDSLTGLPNRVLFSEHLKQALNICNRNQTGLALLFIDLDRFKPVNDRYGHAVGDVLLREVGERIRNQVRKADVVGRIGGDEFVVLLGEIKNPLHVARIAEKIRRSLADVFRVDDKILSIGSSIGIALYPEHGTSATELTRHADEAMYQIKKAGRNRVGFYRSGEILLGEAQRSGNTPETHLEIFPWNENFNTGLEEIDSQHQRLVSILNELAMHLAFKPEDGPALNNILNDLVDYTHYHFQTEEAIWHRHMSGDEDEQRHHQYHETFIEALLKSRQAADNLPPDVLTRDLLAFLTRWLASHILEHDQQMAYVILALEDGLNLLDAKQYATEKIQGSSRQLTDIILSLYSSLARNTLQMIGEIGERQRAQNALRLANLAQKESLERLQVLLDSSQDGIIEMDGEGLVTNWNPQAERIFGYPREAVMGKELALLIVPPAYREAHRKGVAKLESPEASRMLGSHLEVIGMRSDGSEFPLELTIAGMKKGNTQSYSAFVRDISDRKTAQAKIESLTTHDSLTRLPNRRVLVGKLEQALATCQRHQSQGVLLLIDIDQFKAINDSLGHATGDLLLQQLTQRLLKNLGTLGMVARMGGDEFAILIDELQQAPAQTEKLADRLKGELGKPYRLAEQESHITVCIGGVVFGDSTLNAETLLQQASIALYHAKQQGRGHCRFHDKDMQAIYVTGALLEADLRLALEARQFELYYQRQMNRRRQTVAVEALLRWHHPKRGLVSPQEYIALAEESGLIIPIGNWVLETASAQLAVWREEKRNLQIAVNLSARQFYHPDFLEDVRKVLHRHDVKPGQLMLELTESLLLNASDETILKMNLLRELGIGFAMDDFGTGYSSLAYLTQLPLNQLKIDQSFVRRIGLRHTDELIVKTIIGMAGDMNLEVIAEGVETEDQYTFLKDAGCQFFQGYLFGQPVPAARLAILEQEECKS